MVFKATIIVTFVVSFILFIATLSSVFLIDKEIGFNDNNYIYFHNVFMICKFVIIVYSIFLFGYSFTSKLDQYIVIFIAAGISRYKIIITKLIALCIVVLIVCYFSYFQYVCVGFIFYKEFIFDIKYLESFISLLLLALYYGFFSLLLMQIFDNIYVIIIPFALMNLSEIINEDSGKIIEAINYVILNYSNKLYFHYSSIHAMFLIIILVVINIYFYGYKDLKN